MLNETLLGFIGGGNMTQSLISGLKESGFPPNNILVADRHEEKLRKLALQFGVQTNPSNLQVASLSDVLVLAVKPQDMHAVALELKETLKTRPPLIVSIAAGIKTSRLEHWLGSHIPIVRAMPNTPALLRAGATGLYANAKVSDEQKSLAESLLRAVGITVWAPHENDMEIIAALSGSGPAYFFLFMEALQQGAEKLGLSHNAARLLTLQTALGAARMALESSEDLEKLRKRVSSKGGTTEQALNALEAGNIRDLLQKALEAAKNRSIEISHHFDQD